MLWGSLDNLKPVALEAVALIGLRRALIFAREDQRADIFLDLDQRLLR
jgi:hypothetical protein